MIRHVPVLPNRTLRFGISSLLVIGEDAYAGILVVLIDPQEVQKLLGVVRILNTDVLCQLPQSSAHIK